MRAVDSIWSRRFKGCSAIAASTALRTGSMAADNAPDRPEIAPRVERCSLVLFIHRATIRSVSGVYGSAYEGDEGFARIRREVAAFATEEGRRPRMLVVKLGQDGHDRGAKVIATAFADIGFDVDVGPLFQTPEEAARQAIENDVHVIGVSSQAAGHKTLVPALLAALKAQDASDILVVCGGVIPPQDYDALLGHGVAAIYGPGTNIPHAAAEILGLIRRRRKAA